MSGVMKKVRIIFIQFFLNLEDHLHFRPIIPDLLRAGLEVYLVRRSPELLSLGKLIKTRLEERSFI